jgi:dUTP pyrophosphatase
MANPTTIRVKRLPHAAGIPCPRRMTAGASGCDIAAAVDAPVVIQPGRHALVPTGFVFEIPLGYEVQIRPRSGLALKYGILVLNTPGTIDSDYRGEVKVILANLGQEPFVVNRGDRIAQAVPMAVPVGVDFVECDDLSDTARGAGGFGHSGV